LLGKPVFISDNMPAMATGNMAVVYGDLNGLAVKFSEDINIQVLREKYADEHAVGVIGWLELDAKIADQQKIATLKMA
jgi:HK97 family phage major capsid protein